MNRLRRTLLEIWAIIPTSLVVGFLGPFGTYLQGDIFMRWGRWGVLLLGAYVVIRPTMVFWDWIARATRLPRGPVVLWGLMLSSIPLALVWRLARAEETLLIAGYSGLLPFTLLCSLMVLAIVWWADRADGFLLRYYDPQWRWSQVPVAPGGQAVSERLPERPAVPIEAALVAQYPAEAQFAPARTDTNRPRLYGRLTPRFQGDIVALESEDHYVRVHGRDGHSELLLMRLRDAIAEMDGSPGEQVHRSWWIARDAVKQVIGAGRSRQLLLVDGTKAPVARDSVDRLQRSGFLPASA